jgi:uncharacterized protein
MRVVVSGGSGLIGSALVPELLTAGHEVVRLVRRAARTPDEVSWDPAAGTVDTELLQGVEAAVHLSGANVGRPWTKSYKRTIWDSRVLSTRTLSKALTALDPKPRVLITASGVDYYASSDLPANESAPAGSGFFPELVTAWEGATEPAREAGIRVVHTRNGLVVAGKGGAFGPLLRIFRLGLGGRFGSGMQYWSFVSLEDQVRAQLYLLQRDDLSGPVNVTAPNPVTNADLTGAIARAVNRPALLYMPSPLLKAALGGLSAMVLGSHRVLPAKLTKAGFEFRHPTIDQALRAALAKD